MSKVKLPTEIIFVLNVWKNFDKAIVIQYKLCQLLRLKKKPQTKPKTFKTVKERSMLVFCF